jgi:phenylalanine-4-hydroxylase
VTPLTVELPADHPGVHDREYLARRASIAEVGRSHRPRTPIPDVHYSTEEDQVWATVSHELEVLHQRYACDEVKRGIERLALPTERVPQLREVDARLRELSGFRIRPVPGLVPTREFYGSLAERTFLSTQYIRHHSVPFYTPEPDIVHEIIGHATMLASPRLADLYEAAGRASLRATSDDALEFFSRVFWFTLEFGVVREAGEVRAFGAGLLSSYGEIQVFRDAEVRPWDLRAMGTTGYDITQYQPLLFAAPGTDDLVERLTAFFDGFDDATFRRITA